MDSVGFEMGLSGKSAIVTGASGALGGHIAECLGAFGVRCALFSNQNPGKAQKIKKNIEEAGGIAQVFSLEIRSHEAVKRGIDIVVETFHGLNILVNCAGFYSEGKMHALHPDDFAYTVAVNLMGPVNTMNLAIGYMKEEGYGRIVNIGSFAADACLPGTGAYSASKAGLIALTKVVAKEVAPYRITANIVQPGTLNSDVGMVSGFKQDVIDRLRRMTPIGRLGSLNEISSVVLFLCSPHASYINGAVIHVDGGI